MDAKGLLSSLGVIWAYTHIEEKWLLVGEIHTHMLRAGSESPSAAPPAFCARAALRPQPNDMDR